MINMVAVGGLQPHDDVITCIMWKRNVPYWPLYSGIHRSNPSVTGEIPPQRVSSMELWCVLCCTLLNKEDIWDAVTFMWRRCYGKEPEHYYVRHFPSCRYCFMHCSIQNVLFFRMDGHTWHDDVIKWKHFPRYWPFVGGIHRSPVNSPHKG